jgi:UDP-N-acetylglucosamine 2-epimerase (non-hydrolysing)
MSNRCAELTPAIEFSDDRAVRLRRQGGKELDLHPVALAANPVSLNASAGNGRSVAEMCVAADHLICGRSDQPRILIVFGTRPEAIKIAPIARALRACADEFETVLCSTGQHREMLDQMIDTFDLKPDFDLAVMCPRQSLGALSARILESMDQVLAEVQPDLVIVQGDTTSAMIGALSAHYHHAPVAHVEAGLRTGDLFNPFPEEANRRIIGALATLHFAPTPLASRRLRREGIPRDRILITGNTVIDALFMIRDRSRHGESNGFCSQDGRRLVLLTTHRRESAGQPITNLCRAVRKLVECNAEIELVCPVHASPSVREPVVRMLAGHPRIRLIEPLGYAEFVQLLDASYLVLTDSGGIQEEAPALGKPVLVLRDKTERPESISAGTSMLVGTSSRRLLEAANHLLSCGEAYERMSRAKNPYGDGHATDRILAALRYYFKLSDVAPEPFAPTVSKQDQAKPSR